MNVLNVSGVTLTHTREVIIMKNALHASSSMKDSLYLIRIQINCFDQLVIMKKANKSLFNRIYEALFGRTA